MARPPGWIAPVGALRQFGLLWQVGLLRQFVFLQQVSRVAPVEVLPVIDLMGGLVVHGIAGQRDHYRPIRSRLCSDASPRSVAEAYAGLGFRQAYVADLDAIAGSSPDWNSLREIAGQQLRIWLDAGTGRPETLNDWVTRPPTAWATGTDPLEAVIVGLESVSEPAVLPLLVQAIGVERAVFSLDLRGGRPLVGGRHWGDRSPKQIASIAWEAGFRRLIVLDLVGVGSAQGNRTLDLCRRLRSRHGDWQLISGGGVRGLGDLRELAEAGCDVGLVASALHAGQLAAADVQTARSWGPSAAAGREGGLAGT